MEILLPEEYFYNTIMFFNLKVPFCLTGRFEHDYICGLTWNSKFK